jgi:hypothetical protein
VTGAKTIGNRQLAARSRDLAAGHAWHAVLVAVATVIPRISLTEPVGDHLIRRPMPSVQPVRQNPNSQVRIRRLSGLCA